MEAESEVVLKEAEGTSEIGAYHLPEKATAQALETIMEENEVA